MEIMNFSNAMSFNAIFTIYVNLSVLTLPFVAMLALFSKK